MNDSVCTAESPLETVAAAEVVERETNRTAPDARSFEAGSAHFLHRGQGSEFEIETDWVREHLPADSARVLDVGCGIGALFPTIGPLRSIGVDYRVAVLLHTQSRFPSVPLMCAGANRLPFAYASIDAITLQHVVEHLPALGPACLEWRRVLKPGGVLLVLTPNASFIDPSVFDDPTHVRLFDHHDLPGILVAAGFEILDLRTIGLPWFQSYQRIPLGWRFRRLVTRRARGISVLPPFRWKGQTLCCAARRPMP